MGYTDEIFQIKNAVLFFDVKLPILRENNDFLVKKKKKFRPPAGFFGPKFNEKRQNQQY